MLLRWNAMKMNALAYASIDQLSLVRVRLEPCHIQEPHDYVMEAAPVERFVYIVRGVVCFSLENGQLFAGDRDMVYLPRDTAYRSAWNTDADYMVVDLLLQDDQGQDIRFGDEAGVLFNDVHQVYDGLLAELAEKADASGPFDWLERLYLIFKLLCEMARDTNRAELDGEAQKIQPGLTYLHSSFAEDLPVDQLAAMCSLSPASFRRSFFACKGMSPVEYRNRLRIRKAAELLKNGQITVGEAAEQVGIRDIKYFGKLFKRYTGYNPGFFRKHT